MLAVVEVALCAARLTTEARVHILATALTARVCGVGAAIAGTAFPARALSVPPTAGLRAC